jgi:exodeoxyribonuclease VII large subunit
MQNIGLLELNKIIEGKINEINLNSYWIKARIHELNEAYNGHCYLTLVETDNNDRIIAQSRANIWASTYTMLKPYFETETGLQLKSNLDILVKVNVKYHPVYGLSLNVFDIDPTYTVGELELAKQKVIKQLIDDGVFDLNKHFELPRLPQRIAVISSQTAAGYQDFCDQILNNQFNFRFSLKLFPAIVQGENAPQSIIEALDEIHSEIDDFDIVAIMRGGGSKADLICFDDYELCANIAQFPLPIFTGIGHERDESVADLVAHSNAKTPTAIAEYIISLILDEYQSLLAKEDFINNYLGNKIKDQKQQLELLKENLRSSVQLVLQKHYYYFQTKQNSLKNEVVAKLSKYSNMLDVKKRELELSDPKSILKQGYSMVLVDNKRVKSAKEIKKSSSKVVNYFHDGKIESEIKN